MARRTLAIVVADALSIGIPAPAFADRLEYARQPGNQSIGNHHP